jgi:hypothetical protein
VPRVTDVASEDQVAPKQRQVFDKIAEGRGWLAALQPLQDGISL